LEIAKRNGLKSIAFPCISTGVKNYPKEEASKLAINTVREWMTETENSSTVKIKNNVFEF
jgi:O-acetyl-ADP-ribose deacetylase (regulator of RNase III)